MSTYFRTVHQTELNRTSMNSFFSKILILFFVALTTNSCNKIKQEGLLNQFDFDKVEHYSTGRKDSIILKINGKSFTNLTLEEKLYLEILQKDNPTNIADKSFVTNLEKLNFKKRIIHQSTKLKELKKIFSNEFCNELAENACDPMYRDIYIFRKKNQIVGIAKVCFECNVVYFINEKNQWQQFDECDELKTLEKI